MKTSHRYHYNSRLTSLITQLGEKMINNHNCKGHNIKTIKSLLATEMSLFRGVTLAFRSLACQCVCAKSLHLCLILSDPVDHSPPGSSVRRILQAGILEWVAMPSSRGSSQPRNPTHISCLFRLLHQQAASLPLYQLESPHTTFDLS